MSGNGNLFAARLNMYVTFFHVLVGILVLASGGVPWVQLAFIPMNGSLAYGGYKRNKRAIADKQKIELESAQDDALMCTMWEIRRTERKMVEAGIIKEHEMSVCENEKCEECSITRQAIATKARLMLPPANAAHRKSQYTQDSRYKGYRDYDVQFQKWMREYKRSAITANEIREREAKPLTVTYNCVTCGALSTKPECNPCMAASAERRREREAKNQALVERNQKHERIRMVGNLTVTVPAGVPSFADATPMYDPNTLSDYILWEWQYEDGNELWRKQRIDTETYDIRDADDNVIERTTVPTEPQIDWV